MSYPFTLEREGPLGLNFEEDILMKKVLFATIALTLLGVAHADHQCEKLLTSSPMETETLDKETEDLMAYLGTLLEHQIIGNTELVRFIEALEKGELVNPIAEEKAMVSTAALIHQEGIQEYLDLAELNKKELLKWSKESLKEKKHVRVKREEARKETQDVYRKIEFLPVSPGRFLMGDNKKVKVTLTHPIEVMSTPVTQKQWVEIMGENPSKFSKGGDSIVVNVKGKSIRMNPDHPVEQISWWSALEFANRLSEKHGLKPAYYLKGVTWKKGTQAEDGTLEREKGEVKINKDYYQSEGYRLPTEAEQEYLLRAGGKSRGDYHFGDKEEDLKHYAWYGENSGGTTHPVGELRPLVFEGREFYDLHGNVWEWVQDSYGKVLPGGDNPLQTSSAPGRVVRGGGWSYFARHLRSANRGIVYPEFRYYGVGLRLVRTR